MARFEIRRPPRGTAPATMIERFIRFLGNKPLRPVVILLLVAGAGPFAGEIAVLIDTT
ncbi:MAG TPA: hypothetical protein VF339_16500 [Gammaproteobacteria bacterium]